MTTTVGTTGYSSNGLNQYASVTPPGGSATAIGYDADGNLTSDGTYGFTYDAENRLTAASKTGVSASYLYDPSGRRRQKTVTGGSYAGTTQYLSAGDDEIAEYDGSGTLVRRYVPGASVDRPLAIVAAAGAKTFFHQDKTGSVVATSDASGAIVKGPYAYDPYGKCVSGGSECGDGDEPYKYTGRRYDPETGLYYYRARYYSAAIGRFLQTDPVGYTADINLYAYVGNDPANMTDPTGAFCVVTGRTNGNPNYAGDCTWHGAMRDRPEPSANLSPGDSSNNADFYTQAATPGAVNPQQNKSGTPYGFVVEPRSENHGSYTVYHYQLVDSERNVITGEGLVREHVTTSYNGQINQNHENVPLNGNGEIKDKIGYTNPSVLNRGLNVDIAVRQTFFVQYQGKNYNLTTTLGHEVRVVDGTVVTASTWVIVP